MDNFTLDLTKIGCDESGMKAIARGFDRFCDVNVRGAKFFGLIEKKDLKDLCRAFNYTDGLSFVKGGLVTAGVAGAIVLVSKEIKERRKKKASI